MRTICLTLALMSGLSLSADAATEAPAAQAQAAVAESSTANTDLAEQVQAPQRIFISDSAPQKIWAAIQRPQSHHQLCYADLRKRVDTGLPAYQPHGFEPRGYALTYLAREAAFLSVILPDQSEAKRYADLAYQSLRLVFEDPDPKRRVPHDGYGLSRAMMGLGFGFAYNWCFPHWNEEQRDWVERQINISLDAWPSYDHANFHHSRGSNWVAVCRGGELLLILSAGQHKQRYERYAFLRQELAKHLVNGFSDLGASQEGNGYTEYPGTFLIPAVLGSAEFGDTELMDLMRGRPWWKLAMYTQSFQGDARKFVMNGVDHTSNHNQGWISLLLATVPQRHLRQYIWFYDRNLGRLAQHRCAHPFDGQRAGTVWAMLYYPTSLPAHPQPGAAPGLEQDPNKFGEDPSGILPVMVYDQHGRVYFRNRWKDEHDIQVSINADTHRHSHAWDMPEATAINILAGNNRFVGGPGKAGGNPKKDPEHKFFSALLIDGKYKPGRRMPRNGAWAFVQQRQRGGYVIVDGGEHFLGLGAKKAQRYMVTSFDLGEELGLVSTVDFVEAAAKPVAEGEEPSTEKPTVSCTWQANLGAENDSDDGILSGPLRGEDRPGFILRGRDGSWMKSWVIHPVDATIETGDPIRVTTGKDSFHTVWVVSLVGRGPEPRLSVEGEGMDSVVRIGESSLRWRAGLMYESPTQRIGKKPRRGGQ